MLHVFQQLPYRAYAHPGLHLFEDMVEAHPRPSWEQNMFKIQLRNVSIERCRFQCQFNLRPGWGYEK